nr:AlNc14C391G11289 [Albugo laibachii Nc14]|eukprot:CCA26584.1 AlNc14C391G11289 [Albugo laibachii Nc14]
MFAFTKKGKSTTSRCAGHDTNMNFIEKMVRFTPVVQSPFRHYIITSMNSAYRKQSKLLTKYRDSKGVLISSSGRFVVNVYKTGVRTWQSVNTAFTADGLFSSRSAYEGPIDPALLPRLSKRGHYAHGI